MQICLVRHAIAVERGTAYVDDRARPLTPDGRKRMREAASGLKELFTADVILTSPLLRARQTAEILADVVGGKIHTLDALGSGDHSSTIEACAALNAPSVFLVGHEPWMSELLSVFLTGESGAAASVFKKGAAALVSSDGAPAAGSAVLEWLVQPGALRKMAKG